MTRRRHDGHPALAARPGVAAALVLVAMAAVSCRGGSPGPEAAKLRDDRLNVVIVLSDALRASNLPWDGYPRNTAPRLAALAAEGTVFPDHLANYPGTPISVSQMQSGRLMPPLLMGFAHGLAPVKGTPDDLLVLPRALREKGYATAIVSSHPWFDASARILEWFDERRLVPPAAGDGPYAPFERLLPEATDFLDARAEDGRPFYLYVHSMDTHEPYRAHPGPRPWDASAPWPAAYDAYDGAILYTDEHASRLVDGLRERGLLENTIFVFTSDHGEDLGELGGEWFNRSHGSTIRRSQVHVPLIVRAPKRLALASRWPGLSRHVDLAPTLLGLARAGVDLASYRLDGRDLSPALRGEAPAEAPPWSWAHSWRFSALHEANREIVHDQWTGADELFDIRRDARNYEVPVPAASAPDGDAAALAERLGAVTARQEAAFAALPAATDLLGRVTIGVPPRVGDGSDAPPSFGNDPADERWFLKVPLLLEAAAGESPPRLVLETPWAPGRYRLFAKVGRGRPEAGVIVHVLGIEARSVAIERGMADDRGLVPLGEHEIGDALRLAFVRPQGGMSLTGFVVEHVGGAAPLPVDPDAEARLRALGYVE